MAALFIDNSSSNPNQDRDVGYTGGDLHTPVSAPSLTTVMWTDYGTTKARMPNTAGGMACTAEELKQIGEVKLMHEEYFSLKAFKPPEAEQLEQELKKMFPHLSFVVECKEHSRRATAYQSHLEVWERIVHIRPGGAGVPNQTMDRDGDVGGVASSTSGATPVDIHGACLCVTLANS
jgi:hypothetical protein